VIALLLVAAAATSSPALEPLRQTLGPSAAFVERGHIVNEQGRNVTRVQQTFQGKRVWGAEAILHREASGSTRVLDRGVLQGVQPEGMPQLSADQASALAVRELAAKGGVRSTAELVVFPTRFTGGLVTQMDPASKKTTLDLAHSVHTAAPAAPYVWAYEVKMVVDNAVDGHMEERSIVDARTGAILRKWDALRHAGIGHSYFRGTVPLQTSAAPDGTHSLFSPERGTLPQPFQLGMYNVTQVGLGTFTSGFDVAHGTTVLLPYAGHAVDEWGTGLPSPFAWNWILGRLLVDTSPDKSLAWAQGAFTPNGETVAVDAHYGMTQGWDFYQQVFQRNGIDGLGTSTMAIVHFIQGNSPQNSFPWNDNMVWSPDYFGVLVGDGSYPTLSFGAIELAPLDLMGHELAHGVAQTSAGLLAGGLSGALDEGNADIMGKMLQAWTEGQGAATIPDFNPDDPTRWQLGTGVFAAQNVLRYMDRPSDDGASGDAWYDGLEDLGSHLASGPVTRFFVLLAQGVSTDPQSRRYSVYLPQGMAGIGNDHAARIWYRALTEQLFASDNFDDARAATVTAAQELYGVGSVEEQATMKAWAAVNVGSAPGEGPRPRVTMPVMNPPGSFLSDNAQPHGILSRAQLFCTRATVKIRSDVANTDDKRTTLSLAIPGHAWEVGSINADGTWNTPSWNYYGDLQQLIVTSVADPREFAQAQTVVTECDADSDTQTDAIDLGLVAMQWGLQGFPPYTQAILVNNTDWDLVFFGQSFTNSWPVAPAP
jgi:Zn-dependent metalloprotease